MQNTNNKIQDLSRKCYACKHFCTGLRYYEKCVPTARSSGSQTSWIAFFCEKCLHVKFEIWVEHFLSVETFVVVVVEVNLSVKL